MKLPGRKTLLIIAVIGTMALIADCILFFAAEAISGTAFGVTALISAPLAVIPFLLLYAPDEMEEIWKDSGFVKRNWLPRTKESTLFEAASAIILIIAWVIAWASHYEPMVHLMTITVLVISFLISAYNTRSRWNFRWTRNNHMLQIRMHSRLSRIMAVEVAFFGLLFLIPGSDKTFVTVAFLVIAILTYVGAFILNK